MVEKIDKFLDKYLNWKVLINILLSLAVLIPHTFIASLYNISKIPLLIMNLSFGLAISFFTKAIKEFTKREESL